MLPSFLAIFSSRLHSLKLDAFQFRFPLKVQREIFGDTGVFFSIHLDCHMLRKQGTKFGDNFSINFNPAIFDGFLRAQGIFVFRTTLNEILNSQLEKWKQRFVNKRSVQLDC